MNFKEFRDIIDIVCDNAKKAYNEVLRDNVSIILEDEKNDLLYVINGISLNATTVIIICDITKSYPLEYSLKEFVAKINELGEKNNDLQINAVVIDDKEKKTYNIKEVRQFSIVPDVSIIMEENNDS